MVSDNRSKDCNTFHNETSPELQGSILRGILGSIAGTVVCILVMLLCFLSVSYTHLTLPTIQQV